LVNKVVCVNNYNNNHAQITLRETNTGAKPNNISHHWRHTRKRFPVSAAVQWLCNGNKKLSCCCDSRAYCVWRPVNWQTISNRFRLQVYKQVVRTIRFNR